MGKKGVIHRKKTNNEKLDKKERHIQLLRKNITLEMKNDMFKHIQMLIN